MLKQTLLLNNEFQSINYSLIVETFALFKGLI